MSEREGKIKHYVAECIHVSYIALEMFLFWMSWLDRLYGQVVRVPGYRSTGSGFDSRRYQMLCEAVVLERAPLRPMRITEELDGRKISCSGLEKLV
jgi:hypothetical protein